MDSCLRTLTRLSERELDSIDSFEPSAQHVILDQLESLARRFGRDLPVSHDDLSPDEESEPEYVDYSRLSSGTDAPTSDTDLDNMFDSLGR